MDVLRGRVVAGIGDYAHWIELLRTYYTAKTGMRLFPGTLNLRLDQPYELPPHRVIRLGKEEYGGRVSVSIVPVRILGRQAYILRPDLPVGATADDAASRLMTLEVATDVKLRKAYGLRDGDEVEVTVP
jgi:riboflavin kinase